MSKIDLSKAVEEAFQGPSAQAILGAGAGQLLAARGYLSALADGYELEEPTAAESEEFLQALKAEAEFANA